jgi:hypothetical protein
MAITHEQEASGVVNREYDRGAFTNLVVVEVAAVVA